MRIGAILRLVPDISDTVEFTEDHTAIDLEWIDVRLNELDDQALEEALLLAEATQAEVIAISLDTDGADRILRTALARGATRAVKVSTDRELSMGSGCVARAYAYVAKQLDLDLVLVGVQSPEDLLGPLAGRLGAQLDWPFAGAIAGAQMTRDSVLVHQEHGGGYTTDLSVSLPAVLGIQTASKPIRYVSGSKLSETMRAPIEALHFVDEADAADLRVVRLEVRERVGKAEMLEGDVPTIAAKLLDVLSSNGIRQNQGTSS